MSKFLKHLLRFGFLGALFFFEIKALVAQDLSNYQLISVSSDHFYYNIELKDEDLFLGSDAGILAYKGPTQLTLIDPEKRGYIALENGEFNTYTYLKGNLYAPHYKTLLPVGFRHNSIVGTVYNNSLLLISKGQLFVYKQTIKPKADTLSIRSISPNFLGTYNGVFYNEKRFAYPEYTNGYIREFDDETFVCYDGLLRLKGTDTLRYEGNNGNTQIGQVDIGKIKDIFKIDSLNYLLFSEKGLSISDLKSAPNYIEQNTIGLEPRFVKAFYRDNLPIVIYYISGNKLQKYNLLDNTYTTVFQLDSDLGTIEDAYFHSGPTLFILTENRLIQANSNSQGDVYTFEMLVENLHGNHHIIPFSNQLLVSSNDGLSSYNLDTRKWIPNLIRDEFNQRAAYVSGDSIFLGTVNGYYELTKTQVEELVSTRSKELENEVTPTFENYQTETIYSLSVLCIALLGGCIYLLLRSKKVPSSHKAQAQEILAYIDTHLKDVTIVNICHEFKINPLQLNEILGDDKPGELIRSKRLDLVRKMRRAGQKEEEIAQVSGFSISYLKKIKT